MTRSDRRLMSIVKHLNLLYFSSCALEVIFADLCNFADYIGQWIIFDNPIVQDETIGDSIRQYIFPAFKLYSHVNGSSFDRLVLSRAINDRERSTM